MKYRLYFLNMSDRINDAEPFECADDHTAILVAEKRAGERPFELWNGSRMILRNFSDKLDQVSRRRSQ